MYLGWLVTVFILIPNVLLFRMPPTGLPPEEPKPRAIAIMEIFERVGQVGCFVLPILYPVNLRGGLALASLAVMVVMLALYYACWVRFYTQGRAIALFYRPFLGIPQPMAVTPVLYFLAAALLLRSPYLAAAAVILGVGHISVSQMESRRGRKASADHETNIFRVGHK